MKYQGGPINGLVLTRHVGERIVINEDIVIEVKSLSPKLVSLIISAPQTVNIAREELLFNKAAKADKKGGKV